MRVPAGLAYGLPGFEGALAGAVEAVTRLRAAGCPIVEVNVGGGLGRPARHDEQPVDLDAYADALGHISARWASRSSASRAITWQRMRRSWLVRS